MSGKGHLGDPLVLMDGWLSSGRVMKFFIYFVEEKYQVRFYEGKKKSKMSITF